MPSRTGTFSAIAKHHGIKGALGLAIVTVAIQSNTPPHPRSNSADADRIQLPLQFFQQGGSAARLRAAAVEDQVQVNILQAGFPGRILKIASG